MRRASMVLVALVLSAGALEGQQCVTTDRGEISSSYSIDLVFDGWPPSLLGAVNGAMAMWNSATCNSTGASFPYLRTGQPLPGEPVVDVIYADITSNTLLYGTCGLMDPSFTSITIYARARLPNGGTVSCGPPATIAQSLAHELGHLLGLGNTNPLCLPADSGFLMSPLNINVDPNTGAVTYGARSIQPSECTEADLQNLTPAEAHGSKTPPVNQTPPPDPATPILVDLAGNGFFLSGPDDPVTFDIDGDGREDAITWTARGADVGFLCLDRNGNGTIDSGAELFGTATRLHDGTLAPNGYVALREFDLPEWGGNGNGSLDPGDAVFPALRLWVDGDHDGISEPWELITLEQAGIARIGLDYVQSWRRDRYGNQFRFVSSAWIRQAGGRERRVLTSDVFFVRVN
jgi:hypothetical protein